MATAQPTHDSHAPSGLRVDELDSPRGLVSQRPSFSWRLPDGSKKQLAYRLRTSTDWDSGEVRSAENLHLPYAGRALSSGERVEWQVKVWTDLGPSDWSVVNVFELGLLAESDWSARWVTPVEEKSAPAGQRPAHLLREEFELTAPIERALLHVTARGIYEPFVNGERIGTEELTPGFTQYRKRLQVQTHDVTDVLRLGRNALGFILADGWYRGQIGYFRVSDQWGRETSLLCQLIVSHRDGTTSVISSGEGWRSAVGHIVAADLIEGERWDLRREPFGWKESGFDDAGWQDMRVGESDVRTLVGSPAPPVRRVEAVRPRSVVRLNGNSQLVDLGQNINGWMRLSRLGPEGTSIRLVHGEWLDQDGDVLTRNLAPDYPELRSAGQVDEVVSAGRAGDVFEPRRTTHGFQYVRVDGHPEDLTPDDIEGVVVHTDMRRTGWFECSDDRLNRLHEAVVWSLRDNVCDIPTDCPQRERAGWTGDWQLFVSTAAFLFDVAGFSTKWLRDVAADQRADGTVLNFSPCSPYDSDESPVSHLNGSAGWGDAAVIVPWELHRAYGNAAVLEESWPAIDAWVGRIERLARDQRHPERAARRLEPLPHERYLWDASSHWGEWLAPGEEMIDFDEHSRRDQGDLATAYYVLSAGLAARVATILGKTADAERYSLLERGARDAWRAEYITAKGALIPDTQANLVRALAFELVPAELRPAIARHLVDLVHDAGTHLATGFLATPLLLPVLADAGYLAEAYELLLQDTEPSWLVMIDRGANTIWENWNGVTASGEVNASLNHYSKGAVAGFLHRYVAGLQPAKGAAAWRSFEVRPRPGGGITWARAAHESPHGRIESDWTIDGRRLRLRVLVPPGTKASVVLPSGRQETAGPGEHFFSEPTERVRRPRAAARTKDSHARRPLR